MAEGGEEKAVFVALKNDAQQALPKIAEKDAEFVDTTVAKGTKALADHAQTEADITADLKAKMPKDPAPVTARATTSGAAGAEGGGAESTVKGSRLQQALEQDDGVAADAAAPRYSSSSLRDAPNFGDQIDGELDARGLDRGEHDRLRTTATNDLTDDQIQQVVDVRNSIKLEDGQMVTKVVSKDTADKYLDNAAGDRFDPTSVRGSIARGADTADLDTPAKLRDGLALDDKGVGWSPVPEGADAAYQLRFPKPADMGTDISFGAVGADSQRLADHVAQMAGKDSGQAWEDPFTGTGYTGGGVPEWQASPTQLPDHAEIWKVGADGSEAPVGYFDKEAGSWARYE